MSLITKYINSPLTKGRREKKKGFLTVGLIDYEICDIIYSVILCKKKILPLLLLVRRKTKIYDCRRKRLNDEMAQGEI